MAGDKVLSIYKTHSMRLLKHLYVLLAILIFTVPACKTEKQTPQEHLLRIGTIHYNAQEYSQALQAWQKALKLQPGNIDLCRKIGKLYFNQAKYHQALDVYQKVLRQQPDTWDVWLQVARIQLQLLDLAAAENSYKKCKSNLADSKESSLFAGDLLAAKDDLDGAEQSYRQALLLDNKNQAALSRLAICLLGQHRGEKAGQVFQQLTEQEPCDPEILVQMGHYCQLKNNNELAAACLIKAVKQDAGNIHLQIQLAKFYLETNNRNKAIAVFENILAQTPGNRFAKKMLAETLLTGHQFEKANTLLCSLTESERREIDFLLLNGKLALFDGDYGNATQLFQELLRKEPAIPIGHYYLALSYLLRGMNNLGQKSLMKALELAPGFSEAELLLADADYQAGDFEPAMIHAKRVRKKEPENFRAYLIMANIYLARHKYQQASSCYQAAQLLYPILPAPSFGLAQVALAANNPAAARKLLQEIIKDKPSANAMNLYLNILLQGGEHKVAIKTLEQYIKNNPNNPYLYYLLGEVQLEARKQKEAASTFEKVIEYNFVTRTAFSKLFTLYQNDNKQLEKTLLNAISRVHDFPEARIKLANLYIKAGQIEKAIAILEEGLKITPSSASLANNLSWLYCNHLPDKIDEALRLSQLAYEQKPSSAAITDTLGWIYFKKKMYSRSEWMLKQALSLDQKNPEVIQHYDILQKTIQCTPKPEGAAGGVTSGAGSPPPPPEESGKNSPSKPASSWPPT